MCVTSRAISVRVIRALPLACIRDLPQCSRTCHTVLTTHHSAHHTSSFFFTLYLEPVSGAQIRASRYGPIHIQASCSIYGARNKQGPYTVSIRGPLICSEGPPPSQHRWTRVPPAGRDGTSRRYNGLVRTRGVLSARSSSTVTPAAHTAHYTLNVYFSFRLGITGAYDALFACGFRC